MKDKIISIIIPLYNSEKTISYCLDSIINQTFQDYEVILVNDGSTDNSVFLCEEYLKKDTKIKLYSQINKGCSAARNFGIKESKGKYIVFIDSDDWIEEDFLETLYNKINTSDSDIVLTGITFDYVLQNLLEKKIPRYSEEKYYWFSTENLLSYVCNKIYKREFLRKTNIFFREDIHLAEDFIFNFEVFLEADNISVLEQAKYHYIIHENNTIWDLKKRKDMFKVLKIIYDIIKRRDINEKDLLLLKFNRASKKYLKGNFTKLLYAKTKEEFQEYFSCYTKEVKKIEYLNKKEKKKVLYRAYLVKLLYFLKFKNIVFFKHKISRFFR